MSKPSQVIILAEDNRHQQFVRKYLRRIGLEVHAFRFLQSPSGAGSAEHWVREQLPIQVEAFRSRQAYAETKLIVVIDVDTHTFQERLTQLDQALQYANVRSIDRATEQIGLLLPKRNIETWILCLTDTRVDEQTNYTNLRNEWPTLLGSAANTLYEWTRPNAQVPELCVPSLQAGINELKRLDFRA